MKKIEEAVIQQVRQYADEHPGEPYADIALRFGLSEISVKRLCKGLGRSKSWRKGRSSVESDPDAFWARVNKTTDGCWKWTGAINSSDYGTVWWRGRSNGAHRVAWELTNGEIPAGLELDHTCKHRSCVRPDHLELVTHPENMKRAGIIPGAKRRKTGIEDFSDRDLSFIDTAALDSEGYVERTDSLHVNVTSINSEYIDTPHGEVARSMGGPRKVGSVKPPYDAEEMRAMTPQKWVEKYGEPAPWWTYQPKVKEHVVNPLADYECEMREERAKHEAEDKAWGLTFRKIGERKRWNPNLCRWLVRLGSFTFSLYALSNRDVKDMFCSVCKKSHKEALMTLFQESKGSDEHITEQLFAWRDRLQKKYKAWTPSDDDLAQLRSTERSYNEKFWTRTREDKMDTAVQTQMDFEDEYFEQFQKEREQKEAERRASQRWENSDRDQRRYSHYDNGGEDDTHARTPEGEYYNL